MKVFVLSALLPAAALTACLQGASPSATGVQASGGPSSAVPGAPTGDTLAANIAGNSMSGAAISGEAFCTYYAADGTTTGTIGGIPRTGAWTVEGDAICETTDGVTGCSRVDILPTGQVTLTSLDGSGAFQTSATMAAGNQCGV